MRRVSSGDRRAVPGWAGVTLPLQLHARVRLLSQQGFLLRGATLATLALPVSLMYGRTLGEIVIGIIGISFLLERWGRGSRDLAGGSWTKLAALFWVWISACTMVQGDAHAIMEALLLVRFVVLVAALEQWTLRRVETRRYLAYIAAGLALWVIVECWQQYLFGTNVFGAPRFANGSLTGPFDRPRAGPTLLALFLPGLLPVILLLLLDKRATRQVPGVLLLLLGLVTSFLISQDMPVLLLLLGLCVAGLVIRPFRIPLLLCMLCVAVFLAVGSAIAPIMNHRLVVRFVQLIEHFPVSPYGLLFSRALAMVQAHPWTGLGFDGFRAHCMDPQYLHGSSWLPAADPSFGLHVGWLLTTSPENRAGCSIHPHNYWLQIASSAGVPGLILFAALAAFTLRRVGRGLFVRQNPYQVSLFAAVLVIFWPIASTTSLFTMPNAGWAFLTIGWALAEARWHHPETATGWRAAARRAADGPGTG